MPHENREKKKSSSNSTYTSTPNRMSPSTQPAMLQITFPSSLEDRTPYSFQLPGEKQVPENAAKPHCPPNPESSTSFPWRMRNSSASTAEFRVWVHRICQQDAAAEPGKSVNKPRVGAGCRSPSRLQTLVCKALRPGQCRSLPHVPAPPRGKHRCGSCPCDGAGARLCFTFSPPKNDVHLPSFSSHGNGAPGKGLKCCACVVYIYIYI